MIRIELVRDPDGREDDFTIIDYDGDLRSYNETEFKVDIDGDSVSIIPRQIPFYSSRG
tara:strand:+ start:373 stop:546 length:174 start_codon:yes stop_codon:yes gene_type:complete